MRQVYRQVESPAVALETTLLLHGVPRESAAGLLTSMKDAVRSNGANPALVGVVGGRAIVGLGDAEVGTLLAAARVPKANTSNLGALMHRGAHAATTVSTTMELAAGAGLSVFATGGLGGVHKDHASRLDISADLAALARFPVAVVSSGVKSILDVASTREMLETLGIPVVGYRTDDFPSFYARASGEGVDARFDDEADLAEFVKDEMARTNRAVLVVNPVPEAHEIRAAEFAEWLEAAEQRAVGVGRDTTPSLLASLHEVSGGRTLGANIALVLDNASVAARLARRMHGRASPGLSRSRAPL